MQDKEPTWKQWQRENYDGIKGMPPNWVPEPSLERFRDATGILSAFVEAEEIDYSKIKSRFDRIISDANFRLVIALSRTREPYDDYLYSLADIYKAVLMGPEKGMLVLAGKNAARGYKSATAYQRRDDFQDKQDFQGLVDKHRSEIHSVADVKRCPELSSYTRKYDAATLRRWINDVIPGQLKAGRPRTR